MRTPPPRDDLRFSNTTGILQKKKTMWFIGVEVEQETSAPPPKKIPRSAPVPDPDLEIRGARSSRPKDKGEGAVSLPNGEGRNTSSPKNACVGG